MTINYNYELLHNLCNEKGITLKNDYSNCKLYGNSKIDFLCPNCNADVCKYFNFMITRNALCKRCIVIKSLPKQRKTMLEKYGVEHSLQSNIIKEKIKKVFIDKYGVDNPAKTEEVKNKMKKTNLKNYGVEYLIHNKEIQENIKKTNLIKYGFENPLSNKEIQENIKKTMIEKYGVDNPGKNKIFHNKMKETNLIKYGVEYPMQNCNISDKSLNKCFHSKEFLFPSQKKIKCQGYEPFALDELIKNNISEDDIITNRRKVPVIWYNDSNGIKHRHFVDIFVSSRNLCIEVKSLWTLKKGKSNVFLKQKFAKDLGYNYEIWVYDSKGNKIETYYTDRKEK